jgi:hypothetical protein
MAMAIACLRDWTFPPLPRFPDFSSPSLYSFITLCTLPFFAAFVRFVLFVLRFILFLLFWDFQAALQHRNPVKSAVLWGTNGREKDLAVEKRGKAMTERSIYGLLGILAVVALIMFMMTPHEPGSTSEKIRAATQKEVHETADRLNNAFDAAKKDVERQDHPAQ